MCCLPHGAEQTEAPNKVFLHSVSLHHRLFCATMSIPINSSNITAPTPQNTPLQHAPISSGLSRPTVPDISEDNESEELVLDRSVKETMADLVQGRLATLLGKSSGYIEALPVEIKLSISGLKALQIEQHKLQNQYKRECLELEKKV